MQEYNSKLQEEQKKDLETRAKATRKASNILF